MEIPSEEPSVPNCPWDEDKLKEQDEDGSSFPWSWLKWCPTSRGALRKAEQDMLSIVKVPITLGYINIGNFDTMPEGPVKVWTAVVNKEAKGTPLVLVHGFASGLGLWALNYDGLAKDTSRPTYAFDIPGFGQSSRPMFSSDPKKAEEQFVMYIEAWRNKLEMERMILLGHSMGAFLVFSYAIKYPERVSHIILADPWGIKNRPEDLSELPYVNTTQRLVINVLDTLPLNPLWTVRLMGRMGAELIKHVRMDLITNFVHIMEDAPTKVANYIFHCNVQKPLTGESAYHCMMITFGWAKHPLCTRLHLLDPDIPMTLMYGSRSWVDHFPGERLGELRPSSYVQYHVIVAGHHVYADAYQAFNELTLEACKHERPLTKDEKTKQETDETRA